MFSPSELNKVMRLDGKHNTVAHFRPEHLDRINFQWWDELAVKDPRVDYRKYLTEYAEAGTAWTGIGDGKVYACWGIVTMWTGVGEAWLTCSKDISRKALPMHRGAGLFMEYAAKKMKLHRLQVLVRSDVVPLCRWIESLYFERESTLKKYGPDMSDSHLYVRFF